jgi:hypothetical protein
LPDKLGLAHFAEGDTLGKLGVFFPGQACFDYPASVGRVVFFRGCEPPTTIDLWLVSLTASKELSILLLKLLE